MSKMIDKMIMLGAVQVAGVDPDGQFRYSLRGSINDIMPDLYKVHMEEVHETMMHFWEMGFVEFLDMDRAAPRIKLTPKIMDRSAIERLNDDDREALRQLIQTFNNNS